MSMVFEPRRGVYIDISQEMKTAKIALSETALGYLETFDLIYRSLCALLFNYVPTSGHPGGSISSGRIAAGLIFHTLDYDFSEPDREDADIISYAAGHKALGLYAMWALRNEVARIGAAELLAADDRCQLRLEDLLGFRRNPITKTALFTKFKAKALDGHPTPATPFIRLSTGASGIGVTTSLGLAFGARDHYGSNSPWVHIIEGEGGMTPGRAGESMAAAGTASLRNAILHVDWNQASIDSDHVCRDGGRPGDYVQWNPMEFAFLNDWNVIFVPDGKDFRQIIAAQRTAVAMDNSQPTAVVYRTTKGWHYGIEGKASHGAGHKLCSDGFYDALEPLSEMTDIVLPRCAAGRQRCEAGQKEDILEACLWEALEIIRGVMENQQAMVGDLAKRLRDARNRLNGRKRKPRANAPLLREVFNTAAQAGQKIPAELTLAPGESTTLRGELGRVLRYYNKASKGAILSASADLLGSTSISVAAEDFAAGYYNAETNSQSRILSVGGICEDAISGILAGISTFGHNIGVGSSYAAFIAALGHITARLHSIGNQARKAVFKENYRTFMLVCAHAGLKTGEDGPTHADPQALQLLQENFPQGTVITLTPWDPQEIWTLVTAAFLRRPALIAPFVTRPKETVMNRAALGLAPATSASQGVYLLRKAHRKAVGTLVLQGSEVAYAFIQEALPLLEKEGVDLEVYYIASSELFDLLPASERERIFTEKQAQRAMGITGFTLPTMYRWIRSDRGRRMTLHPYLKGHYLGSGQADMVLAEAGLDGQSQFKAIMRYLRDR